MNLEVISHGPRGRARRTPLLFVHGAYGGAWVWEPHFLPFFAERGYEAHAVSLRGHAGSDGHESLTTTRLADYVADVEAIAGSLATPPVLIGHSMGGMVVQKLLHRRPWPGAVLMASGPPHGLLGSWLNMALFNPCLLLQIWAVQTFGPMAGDIRVLKRALFSDATPDDVFWRWLPRFRAESPMVVLDMLALDLPPSRWRGEAPVLVLGAEHDLFVYPGALRETAKTYGTDAETIAGIGHAMMLDHGWQTVAERIAVWLDGSVGGAAVRDLAA